MQVREGTAGGRAAGGDNTREHTTVGVACSADGRPQAETHSQVAQTRSLSLCHPGLACHVQKEESCVPDPRSSLSPGLTFNSELSQSSPIGSSVYIPAQLTYDRPPSTLICTLSQRGACQLPVSPPMRAWGPWNRTRARPGPTPQLVSSLLGRQQPGQYPT